MTGQMETLPSKLTTVNDARFTSVPHYWRPLPASDHVKIVHSSDDMIAHASATFSKSAPETSLT